jgi:hypothetical protein
MTPAREDLPPQPLRDENNYDISDIRSDEDTDDEDQPRKVVPRWASDIEFRTLLLRQAFLPPDVDHIFSEVGPVGKNNLVFPFRSTIKFISYFVRYVELGKSNLIIVARF